MGRFYLFFKKNWVPLSVLGAILLGSLFFVIQKRDWAHGVWFTALMGGGLPIVYQTAKGMLQGRFASDIVAMLAIITAFLLNEAFAGAVVVLMQSGGEAIEQYGFRKASRSLMELLQRAPTKARRKIDGHFEEIDVERVCVGDILLVRPGELVPVDGTILKGSAEIDESALTGEPIAKERREGDLLLSGSIDLNGAFEMRAEKKSHESQYAKIVQLVEKAQQEKAPIQRLADRYAVIFTPLTLFMGAVAFFITKEPTSVLSVFVVATPCPLILATPLAVICGINRAARAGIIVKGGASIEQIASTKGALFDKTGTLTFGAPSLEKVISFGGETEKEVLYRAAILEQFSTHSIARAIVEEGIKAFHKLPLPQGFQEVPGQGVSGKSEGVSYVVGSQALIDPQIISAHEKVLALYREKNRILIFVVRDGVLIGVLVLMDQLRPNAASVIRELRGLGVQKIGMITGDQRGVAEEIGKQVGIDTLEAELLPEAKVESVKQFRKEYEPMIMVGDGINDAPALASATVGIAMGAHGTAISAEAADIVLLVDDLAKVSEAVLIGKRMLRVAKQSILIGMGLSFILMVIASFGHIPPPIGALLQEIIDVAVILNALRVL